MKNTTIPVIEEIKLSTLIVDPALSGRSAKEITANAKELAPKLTALGYWDMSQPGQYFERDGKKHLSAGFTRCAAAELANIKVGYFVRVEDDPLALRTACIRTNLGKPIGQYEQGKIYAAMRDGTKDLLAVKPGELVLPPMEIKAIADEVGYSRQWVEMCIGVFEETPEIAELLIEGKVSAGMAHRARQLCKADGKRLAFLKAAITEAKRDGKEVATMKHLEAVKADFAPAKAAKTEEPEKKEETAKAEEKPASEAPAKEKEATKPVPQSTLDLGTPSKGGKKKAATLKDVFPKVFAEWAEETSNNSYSDEDLEKLITAMEEAGITLEASPL